MSLAAIQSILDAGPARRVEPGSDVWLLDTGPWWRLFTAFDEREAAKLKILEAAWQLPSPLFLLPPEPLEKELEPFVLRDAPAWRLDRTRTAAAFYRTEPASGLGNWQLYAASRPVAIPHPDLFRTKPRLILTFMREQEITLLIDVFHDDADWCVAVLGRESVAA